MTSNRSEQLEKPLSLLGRLSLILGPVSVLITLLCIYVTVNPRDSRWFDEYPQYILQYVWLALLLVSLVTGAMALIKRARPRWLALGGTTLSLSLLFFLTLFLRWLED